MTNTLKVISPCLLNAKMSVNRSISGSSRQVFAISVWNMLSSLWVSESLGQTKIDHINVVLLFADSNQEVVGFDISVDDPLLMNDFNSLNHLCCNMKNRSQIKLFALSEQVLKTLTQQIHHHNMKLLSILSLFVAHEM